MATDSSGTSFDLCACGSTTGPDSPFCGRELDSLQAELEGARVQRSAEQGLGLKLLQEELDAERSAHLACKVCAYKGAQCSRSAHLACKVSA